jgi:TET-associated glycosyltransferase-like protein
MGPKGPIDLLEGRYMEIYIPSRGRVFQETFTSLPKELQERVHFIVPYDDMNIQGVFCHKTPKEIDGIGPTRQWIIDQAQDKKIVMLDDDIVFATRREDEPAKFRPSVDHELRLLFDSIDSHLDSFAHVGVSTREGGNRDTNSLVFNTRLLRILAYRTDVLRSEEVRFDRLEFMEDFDVTLQLLRKGYSNVKINWIVHNQRSSNAPGGCSTYRTLEKQSQAAKGLASLHPKFVAVVQKTTKTAWNGATRDDVIIQWKRAFCADTAGTPAALDTDPQPDPT